jgi:hypothetical protein
MAKYVKKISVGAFLKKGEDIKENDIVEIANEGRPVEGQFGTQDVFMVKVNGKEGNVSFNQTTINNLIDGYGEDSIDWIGKKAKVWAILSNVQGKMKKVYYFLHPDTELDEKTGQFIVPGKTKIDIPTIEDDEIPSEFGG